VGVVSFILLDLKRSKYLNKSRKQNEEIILAKQDEKETLVASANKDQIIGTIKNMNNSKQFKTFVHLCNRIFLVWLLARSPKLLNSTIRH
jgi:uncharacterized surface protein with fasciclin (FAS1) repeats